MKRKNCKCQMDIPLNFQLTFHLTWKIIDFDFSSSLSKKSFFWINLILAWWLETKICEGFQCRLNHYIIIIFFNTSTTVYMGFASLFTNRFYHHSTLLAHRLASVMHKVFGKKRHIADNVDDHLSLVACKRDEEEISREKDKRNFRK